MPVPAFKLAKEIGMPVKDLIERALDLEIVIKGNFSALDDEAAERLRKHLMGPSPEELARIAAEQEAARLAQEQEAAERAAAEAAARAAAEKAAADAKAAEEAKAKPKAGARKGAAKGKKSEIAGGLDLSALLTPPPKAEPPKPPAAKVHVVLPLDLPSKVKVDVPAEALPSKESMLHLKADAPEVRVLRPTEIEKFTRETPVEPEKEKRQAKPLPVGPAVRRPGPPAPAAPPPEYSRFRERPRFRREVVRHDPVAEAARRAAILDREIEVALPITVKDFCQHLGLKAVLVMRKLLDAGTPATLNATLSEETVLKTAQDFKRKIKIKKAREVEQEVLAAAEPPDRPEDLVPRAPVVTFMGHVDHGKTSLLDRIRQTNVAEKESGGITQHIGAWKVQQPGGVGVVFLDTPGHEAFTAMRARGAHVTDVAVLVVAADDGVMPQTEEAINHARAANVKIVVALNKCDKKEANLHRVKSQLSALGLVAEDWGGNTIMPEVSAITGQGVDKLIEMLALEAEMLELKSNPKRPARGAILEAKKHDTRGVLATALVQDGTLKRGDVLVCGTVTGRVRALSDHLGRPLESAGPSTPVELLGLTELPAIGEPFRVVPDLEAAKAIVVERIRRGARPAGAAGPPRERVTLENLFTQIEAGRLKEIRVVLKTDVKGSAEVLEEAFTRLSTPEVRLRVLHTGIGNVNESDIILADASEGLVIGFNVVTEDRAKILAQEKRVDIRHYQVIYHAVEELKASLEGLLEPEKVEIITGHVTVKQIFKVSRLGNIAGCMVTDGKIERSSQVRLIRDKQVTYTGRIESLKRFKDDVKEALEGFECGIRLAGHDDIRPGDVVEAFQIQLVAKKLK
jgi:translation initiation factor IF-2